MGVRRAAALLALLALLGAQGTAAFYLPGALAAGGGLTTLPLFEWASALLGGAPARAGLWAIAGASPRHDRGAGRALEPLAAPPLLPLAALCSALRVALLLAHALDACVELRCQCRRPLWSAGVAPQDFKKVGWAAAAVPACSFGWRPAFGWVASAAAASVARPAAQACEACSRLGGTSPGHPLLGPAALLPLCVTHLAPVYCPSAPPQGDPITLKVNKLMSVKNLPYQFYSLPYCRPDKVRQNAAECRGGGECGCFTARADAQQCRALG